MLHEELTAWSIFNSYDIPSFDGHCKKKKKKKNFLVITFFVSFSSKNI